MNEDPRSSGPSPSISPPAEMRDIELPFGPPPKALLEQGENTRLPEELRKTVRALVNNAEKIRRRSPLIAAQCLHEAGRLLYRRAKRFKDAWVCCSRALAVYPDYGPALFALIELARKAGADDALSGLLDNRIARTEETNEKVALLTEAAAVRIRTGDLAGAREKLTEAVGLSQNAVTPRILLALLFAAASPEENRQEMLAPLYRATSGSRIAKALARHGAITEDLSALEQPEKKAALSVFDESSLPVLWIRFRTFLRRGNREAALSVLSEMKAELKDGLLLRTLSRMQNTLCRMIGEAPPGDVFDKIKGEDLFYDFIEARMSGNHADEIRILDRIKREARAPALKNAAALHQMLRNRQPGRAARLSFGPNGASTPAAKAVLEFLKMDSPADDRNPKADATELFSAVNENAPKALIEILKRLRAQTPDLDAKWPFKVAECALEIEHPPSNAGEGTLATLKSEEAHRSPLPSIVRRTERRHRRLAELCIGEAKNSDDPQFVASRLAWAGYHLESLDPFDAARLYTEALASEPSLLFAVKGLERIGTQGKEAAALYRCAAEAARDDKTRAAALLRAGILLMSRQAPAEAAPLLGEAAMLMPEEDGLQRIALRLALTYPNRVGKNYISRLANENVQGVHPFLLGTLFLFTNPGVACGRFEEALSLQPGDPLPRLGLTESLLRAGRASIVSEQLFDKLRNTTEPADNAAIVLRLAHIDRFYREDESSAALFADSLVNQLPGHRSTLARLMVYYMTDRRPEDFRRVLTALSSLVSNEDDAAAMARLCTLGEPATQPDLLRQVTARPRATLLELTAMEAVTDDPEERSTLLEKITALIPQSGVYLSRLADSTARAGRPADATALYKQSLESRLTLFHNLHRMTDCLYEMEDDALTLDTLVIAADAWSIGTFKAQALHKAAEFAFEKMGNFEKTTELCLLALHADPEEAGAFALADNLLSTVVHNFSLHLQLLETRLNGYCDPVDEIVIRLKIRYLIDRLSEQSEQPDKEEIDEKKTEHLRAAIELTWENRPDKSDHEYTSVWDNAVFDAVFGARIFEGRVPDAAFFSSLGQLYLKKLTDPYRAEKYFDEALRIDENNPEALSGAADILLKRGDTAAASQILGRLTAADLAPKEKLEKLLVNAEILRDSLHEEKEAEEVLLEARKTAPSALRPIEALADIYERQNNLDALSAHLDTALKGHADALSRAPDDKKLYENIRVIAERKADTQTAAAAEDMLALLKGSFDLPPKSQWTLRPGRNIIDSTFDERICPSAVPAGLRKILKAIEIPLGQMLGVTAENANISALEKPRRRDKIAAVTAKLAALFGIEEPVIRVGTTPVLRVVPGARPLILMPPAAVRSDAYGVKRFAAAAAIQWIRLGISLTTMLPPRRLRGLLAGLARIFYPNFAPEDILEEQVEKEAFKIRETLPEKTLDAVKPFARDILTALDAPSFTCKAETAGHRAGLLAAGSLPDAIAGLRAISGLMEEPISSLPCAGELVGFAFSPTFSDIRREFKSK